MIGASLSGVTFISVPGWVENQSMSYMQMVFGYIVGYAVIGLVLLPLYYQLNLTSIYTYLEDRFGRYSYKTGASFFLLSRTIGAAFRLFLVANVLQLLLFDEFGIPFWFTVTITILLIWLYTFKGGIKTIVWTDTLQTLFMLIAVGVCIYTISDEMNISNIFSYIADNELSKTFFFEDYKTGNYFWKRFFSGAFIAIVMTGLDQDMMQKNLTVARLKDSQKNMVLLGVNLLFVNALFLALGILLTDYAALQGITATGDKLFASVATSSGMPALLGAVFFLGLLAAAFSSADSALASLTTAFCVDFLGMHSEENSSRRTKVYFGFMAVLLVVMLLIYSLEADSIISALFTAAGYTYGPLLGLFAFALTQKRKIQGWGITGVAIVSPFLAYALSLWAPRLGYTIGFELLLYNGLITYFGAWTLSRRA